MKNKLRLCFFIFLTITSYGQFFEDFEGTTFPPAGWLVDNNGIGNNVDWTRVDEPPTNVYDGVYSAYINRTPIQVGQTSEHWLVTSQVNVPINGQLKFFSRTTIAGNQGTLYQIRVSTGSNQNDLSSYSVVAEFNENQISAVFNEYSETIVNLNAFVGQNVYVAFVRQHTQLTPGLNGSGDRWLVDNILIDQQCFDPTALSVSNISFDSAQLSWGNPSGATQWEVEIVQQPGAPTGSGILVNTNPYTATGLQESTQYQFFVRAICSANNMSNWVGPFTFETPIPGDNCSSALPIPSLPYSTSNNTANFNSSVNGSPGSSGCGTNANYLNGPEAFYTFTAPTSGQINVRLTPSGPHSGVFVYTSCANVGVSCVAGQGNTNANLRNFNFNAVAGQTYYVVVSTSPSAPNVEYNLVIQYFQCNPPPTNLNVTNVTQNSATLNWNQGGTAIGEWEVALQPVGGVLPPDPSEISLVNTNSFEAINLQPGTQYQFWVKGICSDVNSTIWVGPFVFTTAFCEPADQCTYTFNLTSTGGGWQGATMQVVQDGVLITTLGGGFNSGVGPQSIDLTLCNTLPFQLVWNQAGGNPSIVGVSIVKNSPIVQTIYSKPPGEGSPNTTLFSGIVDCNTAACLPPNNIVVSNITIDEATITWDSQGVETQWQIIVQEASLPAPNNGSAWQTVNTTPTYTATGLNNATIYNVYIRSVCGVDEFSAIAGPVEFNTLTCLESDKCNYTFILSREGGSLGWNGATMQVRQNGIVVATLGATFTTGVGPINVTVPLCNGIPFDVFWNQGGSSPANVRLEIVNSFSQTMYLMNTPSASLVNQVVYSAMVDCDNQACLPPFGFNVDNMASFSATLSWSEAQGGPWEVIALPVGSPAPSDTDTGLSATSSPFVYTGLIASTNYNFFIRTLCSGVNSQSSWQGPITGLTLPSCPQPTGLEPFIIDNNQTNISWTEVGTATLWEIVVVDAGEPISSGTVYQATTNPFSITDLDPGVYEYYIRAICSDSDQSLWSGPQSLFVVSDLPACAAVDVTTIDTDTPGIIELCPGETCVPMSASYLETGVTNTYEISPIPFSPPFPFSGGIPLNVTIDDVWSPLQPLGFDFCFFGQPYSNVLVGSNGVITFNFGTPGYIPEVPGGCPWSIPDAPLPNTNFPIKNAIFGVYQDINPAVGAPVALNDINYQVIGSAPCRVFVANFNQVAQFSCGVGVGLQTSQVVLYETSNVIDIYIQNRTPCNTWQGGRGVAGILNIAGNVAYVPPGRNVGNWTATNEAWRFIPNEGSNVQFSWLKDGQFFSDDKDIEVCVEETTVMTAQAIYTGCDGIETIVTSDILLNVPDVIIPDFEDVNECGSYTLPELTLTNGQYFTAPDGPNGTGVQLAVGTQISSSQTIYVYADLSDNNDSCIFQDDFEVTIGVVNVDEIQDVSSCDNFELPSLVFGNFFSETNGGGTSYNSGDVITASMTMYIFNESPDVAGCTNESSFEINIIDVVTPTFDPVADICPGVQLDPLPTTSLNGVEGSWSPALNNQSTTTYTFTPNVGQCATTATLTITVLPNDIAPTFENLGPFCIGTNFTLESTSLNGITGTWSPAVNTQQTTTYTFTPDSGQCATTATMTVVVNPLTAPTFSNLVTSICSGAVLDAFPTTSSNGIEGSWSPSDLNITATTTFTFTPTDGQCASVVTHTVNVTAPLVIDVEQGCEGASYVLSVQNPIQGVTYNWTGNGIVGSTTGTSVVVGAIGTYTVSYDSSSDLCASSEGVTVQVINCLIPKGISPNGDGLNERLDLRGFNVSKLTIMNRHGREVYSKVQYKDEWGGQSNSGSELPVGTYYYLIELVDDEPKTGWIYINREQ